jgi:hypothetical protein
MNAVGLFAATKDLTLAFDIPGAVILAVIAIGCLRGLRHRGVRYQIRLVATAVILFLALIGTITLFAAVQVLLAPSR